MSYLIQIFLPMSPELDKGKFEQLAQELTSKFGGVTARPPKDAGKQARGPN